jgi:hypothetical protein
MKPGGLVKPTWLQFWFTRETLRGKYGGAARNSAVALAVANR